MRAAVLLNPSDPIEVVIPHLSEAIVAGALLLVAIGVVVGGCSTPTESPPRSSMTAESASRLTIVIRCSRTSTPPRLGHDGPVAVTAVVREWDEAEGWGVLVSPQTPGGCWTYWSSIAVDGFRSLAPGQDVELEWEPADQDGYSYRALRAWPAGVDPVDDDVPDRAGAYSSTLTIRFDDDAS